MPRTTQASYVLLCILLMTMPSVSDATVIVVIPKSEAIWVGADGLRTDQRTYSNVCKVHEAYGGVLLKFGNDTDDDKKPTYSTDAEVRHLVAVKKSFVEFQQAAADLLWKQANETLRETVKDIETDTKSKLFDEKGTTSEGALPSNVFRNSRIGLVFIGSEAGMLIIHQLIIEPTVVAVNTVAAEPRYRWVINKPTWAIGNSMKLTLYGPVFVRGIQDQRTIELEKRMSDKPEKMSELLPNFSNYLNTLSKSCAIGEPYTILKITTNRLDAKRRYSPSESKRLLNTAYVEYKSPGKCPSWKITPIPRPGSCPLMPNL